MPKKKVLVTGIVPKEGLVDFSGVSNSSTQTGSRFHATMCWNTCLSTTLGS